MTQKEEPNRNDYEANDDRNWKERPREPDREDQTEDYDKETWQAAGYRPTVGAAMVLAHGMSPNGSKLSGERPPAGRTRVRCSALLGADLAMVPTLLCRIAIIPKRRAASDSC